MAGPRWDDLDTALATAVPKVAQGGVKRELLHHHEERASKGILLAGRAAFWIVSQRFRLDKGAAMGVVLHRLTQLEIKCDLEGFLSF